MMHVFIITAPYAMKYIAEILKPFNNTKRKGIEVLHDDVSITIKMNLHYGCVRNVINNYKQFVRANQRDWKWLNE
jgi:flavorubredoxin